MATTASDTKVLTGKVRLGYVHLFEAFSNQEGQEPKFSVMIIIPKSDTATLKKIKRAQKAAAEAGKATKFNGKIPANLKTTLKDGDEDADLEKNPELEGHYYMTISSKTRPGVVDKDLDDIIDSSEVYSGCYARVSMNCFAYNTSGNRGVTFGLNHVQKIADGDYLGGRTRATDDFDKWEDEDDDWDEDDDLDLL